MKREQQHIHEFMVKAQQATPNRPSVPSREVRELRVRLIAEELLELCDALNVSLRADNTGSGPVMLCVDANEEMKAPELEILRDAYDAIVDLLVVTIGTGVAMGVDLEEGWDEVHRSNMSKFIDGYRRADGKWVKGPSYTPARLLPLLKAQIEAAAAKEKQLLLG